MDLCSPVALCQTALGRLIWGDEEELSATVNEYLECLQLPLGMDDEMTESFWISIKGEAGTRDFIARVFYRLPDQVGS